MGKLINELSGANTMLRASEKAIKAGDKQFEGVTLDDVHECWKIVEEIQGNGFIRGVEVVSIPLLGAVATWAGIKIYKKIKAKKVKKQEETEESEEEA